MYEAQFKFREKPFSLLPDPGFLFLGNAHGMALSLLQYALNDQAGFTVVTGEVGCGKTTLIRYLLNTLDPKLTVGLISNTHDFRGELLKRVLYAFGQDYKSADGNTDLFDRFTQFLLREYARGQRVVIVVDEAQNMSAESLEELRVLSNVNADKDQLLQIVLFGQPELRDTLREPRLRQFAQRIAVDYHLGALDEAETERYIHHRVKAVGGDPLIFPEDVCRIVHVATGGTPRLVNVICELALVYAYGLDRTHIDARVIEQVIRDKTRGGLFATSFASAQVVRKAAEPPAGAESAPEVEGMPVTAEGVTGHTEPAPLAYLHEGIHVLVNPPYARLLGFRTPDELFGVRLEERVVKEERAVLKSTVRRQQEETKSEPESRTFALHVGQRIVKIAFLFGRAELDGEPCIRVTASTEATQGRSAEESAGDSIIQLRLQNSGN